MQKLYDDFRGACANCTDSSCKQYAYSVNYLAKHEIDLSDPQKILTFLKEAPPRRRSSCFVAATIYYRRVLKDEDSADMFKAPLLAARDELRTMERKQEGTESQRKNWVDY